MSVLRVNSISGIGSTSVELSRGLTIPSGSNLTAENLNCSGITTVASLVSNSLNVVGVLTASVFYGNGSGLTGVPGVSISKAFGVTLIS